MKTICLCLSLSSILLTLVSCATTKVPEGNVSSGPFDIRWNVESKRTRAWYNNGGNRNTRQYISYFSVYHRGKLIEAPADNEGRHYFWQALFLTGSVRPAVLVGVHNIDLLTEQDGQLMVVPLAEQTGAFASYQWIDSETGRPGLQQTIYLGDNADQSRFLTGGRYLLVNGRAVLDVRELKVYPLKINQYEQVQSLGGYKAGSASLLDVSPSGRQLVFWGERANPDPTAVANQFALVVVDYQTNEVYSVPFDQLKTRFFSSLGATSSWVKMYFEWTTDKSGQDRLRKRV